MARRSTWVLAALITGCSLVTNPGRVSFSERDGGTNDGGVDGGVRVDGGRDAGAGDAGPPVDGGPPGDGGVDAGTTCGDGVLQAGEECDDANDGGGDGCDGCEIEAGHTCYGAPSTCVQCENLQATIRDFSSSHPDFQAYVGSSAFTGIVEPMLGVDRTPDYAFPGGEVPVTSFDTFLHWYHDVSGVNQRFSTTLPLSPVVGGLQYDDSAFFPIDGMGFGDEGFADMTGPRNFHFTTEIHTRFVYRSGQTFTFTGDDDVWVFINDQLAIDLGGVHGQLSATVDLTASAASLGLTEGEPYALEIFHAERYTVNSNFRIQTTIDCFFDP